jgi:hypothetical protein
LCATAAGVVLALCIFDRPLQAQPAQTASAGVPAAMAGVAFGPSTNDASSRMRLYEQNQAFVWVAEGGFAVARRLGIGLEYSEPSAATAFTTVGLGRFQISGRQEERVVIGLLRVRLGRSGRLAFDVVGGGGVVFQHHETGSCIPPQARCETTDGPVIDERAPALAVGLDVPVRLARHFEVAAAARSYFLRRGEHTSESDLSLQWQYEWRSSTRLAILVGGRILW